LISCNGLGTLSLIHGDSLKDQGENLMKTIIKTLVPLFSLLILVGCAPRLPERTALDPNSIPELADGNARVYVLSGAF
jgi:hypothetical protein